MYIGGEHTFSPGLLFKPSNNSFDNLISDLEKHYFINYTFGGYYSLLAILDHLKSDIDEESEVLLPSYLCQSILQPFKARNIKYNFYRVDQNLYVDISHLLSLINKNVKAVLFIDYFGATQKDRLSTTIDFLSSKNIFIIQDMVQCLHLDQDKMFGDYIFNSFRKFFPIEGSVLLSKKEININFSKRTCSKFVLNKRMGQLLRYFHVNYGMFSSSSFLKFFKTADKNYYDEQNYKMSKTSRAILKKFDIDLLIKTQKQYYQFLLDNFGNYVPELLNNQRFVPLGFVIVVPERDLLRKKLFLENVYPPVHWILSDEIDDQLFSESIALSKSILTFPLLNMNDNKFDFMIKKMLESFKD
ncbi:MAG TPA: hypothetical protein PLW31_03665 [Bacteroidales bacterium]|nr:hypothetical protein [Bacteroidales bacterium]HPM91245.1 hypothetical protein [Bacteroidales bacterium]